MNDTNLTDFTLARAVESYKKGELETAQTQFLNILNHLFVMKKNRMVFGFL